MKKNKTNKLNKKAYKIDFNYLYYNDKYYINKCEYNLQQEFYSKFFNIRRLTSKLEELEEFLEKLKELEEFELWE